MNIFETDDNSTPLTEEEKMQLQAKWVTTRAELNELEAKGIAEAEIWLLKTKKDILCEEFIKTLHKKCLAMFGNGPACSEKLKEISVLFHTKFSLN